MKSMIFLAGLTLSMNVFASVPAESTFENEIFNDENQIEIQFEPVCDPLEVIENKQECFEPTEESENESYETIETYETTPPMNEIEELERK